MSEYRLLTAGNTMDVNILDGACTTIHEKIMEKSDELWTIGEIHGYAESNRAGSIFRVQKDGLVSDLDALHYLLRYYHTLY